MTLIFTTKKPPKSGALFLDIIYSFLEIKQICLALVQPKS